MKKYVLSLFNDFSLDFVHKILTGDVYRSIHNHVHNILKLFDV